MMHMYIYMCIIRSFVYNDKKEPTICKLTILETTYSQQVVQGDARVIGYNDVISMRFF